ncbi:CHAT domain-containing protein [Merismopedia glauca]|uniref:CHAT domain-containing protein n=1 Tax=Merismopedia glauca CCAP 1448/3 TaxID=1296344 RepID=A0A2T1BXD9_9CYAN|nr:CHAT domain-containing protein [Merismopedia glauca]PSB00594.1 hypothetical protein C7B64_22695 [Merismopedia glauca CCAP 1448/3]
MNSQEKSNISEERLQSYLDLIHSLLQCSIGEENQILQAREDLLDRDLVSTINSVANHLEANGQKDSSDFLMSLAEQLLKIIDNHNILLPKCESAEDYERFLIQLLQIIAESQSNTQAIYSFLEKNLDKIDDTLGNILETWGLAMLESNSDEEAAFIASVIGEFSNLIQQFPSGDRATNIDLAIRGYQIILTFRTYEKVPLTWAAIQNNLSSAYFNRLRGNIAENLEKAIDCCQNALKVYTRDSFPIDWAMVCLNLGIVFDKRIKGHRAENLEQAIDFCKAALEVYRQPNFPVYWASVQNSLGNAYSQRTKGDRSKNLDLSIACYQSALTVYTQAEFPIQWLVTQNNLASAYSQRILGKRAENIEQAIAGYQMALQVRTQTDFPVTDFPVYYWAMTQNNLANTYANRIRGDQAENLERAIESYQNALTIYTQTAFPENWAATQNNLANAYENRIKGDKAENIERAIAGYQMALQVRTQTDFPISWAATQNNLANAYANRIRGDQAKNLERAIESYQNALRIRTPLSLPLECLQTAGNLGNLSFAKGNWQFAIESYSLAIEALQLIRIASLNDERRQEIVAESFQIYENIILAYIKSSNYEKALEYVERSRSQHLVDLMASNALYQTEEMPAQVQQYLETYKYLQEKIDRLRSSSQNQENIYLETPEPSSLPVDILFDNLAEIIDLEAEKQLIWQKIRSLDPVLIGQIQVQHLNYCEIQSLINDSRTAILDFYTSADDTYVFIVKKDLLDLYTLRGKGRDNLQTWLLDKWLLTYLDNREEWLNNLTELLRELSIRLEIEDLINSNLEEIEQLIIVPHLYLHLIPFSSLFVGVSSEQNLIDKFTIQYISSCHILKLCQERPSRVQTDMMGIIEDPNNDLIATRLEGDMIAKIYNVPDSNHLKGREQATVMNCQELAKKNNILHFSCHGFHRFDNPLESQLLLSNGNLTVGELLTLRFTNLQEVFLSACETGISNIEITDDILNIGTAFLCAGAKNVISTLWAVNDVASALLSIFYYQNKRQGINSIKSLKQSQLKLRSLSGNELTVYWQQIEHIVQKLDDDNQLVNLEKFKQYIALLCQQEYPFASPYYWAGFIYQGANLSSTP